ncbi:hypothetical protein DL546_009543 [Coniochaeta pulveracea]|uniref:Uncharacterized protein n=1 Tax=Coniochaeta pulveracea TaxID=177199 RepID=A0A420YNY9_9PEZI|nr:hypothetical protein DL546_009543 [Coniochaeta pulveracea]
MAPIDVPPPPYTETDIYSASSGSRSHRANSLTPDDSISRGAAPALSTASTTSSTAEVIYTPPETPRPTGSDNFSSAGHIPLSSAAAYFASRPPWANLVITPRLRHSISIRRDTTPDDVPYPPYPQILETRDVQHQDWKTFLNYLLPNHTSESNSAIIDRKVREEGDDVRSQVASDHLGGRRSKTDDSEEGNEWKEQARATVRNWNEGFFHPRGIEIVLILPGEAAEPGIQIPGAWHPSYDQRQDVPSAPSPRGGLFGGLLGRFTTARTAPGTYNNGEINNQRDARAGLRLGGVVIGEDGVSIGDRVVVGSNGLRIGGRLAAGRGRGHPLHGGPPNHFAPSGPFGGPRGDWQRGGWSGPFGPGGPFAGVRGPAHRPHEHGGSDCHGGRGRRRGRRHDEDGKGKGRHRSRSSSSSYSSSSSSSTSSEESVGSLPAYDDLKDNQLPLTRDFLQKWLDHPDQPVTKASLKEVKANLKAASKAPSPGSNNAQPTFDRVALRKEVKAMMGEWKALRKRQKKERRAMKKQRREVKRAAKRERREARRAGKRERKEARREARRGPGNAWRGGVSGPVGQGAPCPPGASPGRGGFVDRFGGPGYTSVDRAARGPPTSHSEGIDHNPALDNSQTEIAALEKQIAEKESRLVGIHAEIAREQEEGIEGRQNATSKGKSMSPAVRKALDLEKEIDEAVRSLESLRVQNDERLARNLGRLEI